VYFNKPQTKKNQQKDCKPNHPKRFISSAGKKKQEKLTNLPVIDKVGEIWKIEILILTTISQKIPFTTRGELFVEKEN
jgi:hypothetical protein